MNTKPNAVTVLCYGDSNTNGTKPDRTGRFASDERWPGVLQNALGDNYYVIEEGLGGRTTDLEHPDSSKPSRNGLVYFKACVDSHAPLDVIIIMLGTNDLKTVYDRSAQDVANALKQYPEYVKQYCERKGLTTPKIILASPVVMDDKAAKFAESMPTPGIYDEVSAAKTREFPGVIEAVAKETGCIFFDAAKVAYPGEDGCHLDAQGHQALGSKFAELIPLL